MSKLLLIVLTLIITGCNKQSQIQTKVESKDSVKTMTTDSVKKESNPGIMEGLYIVNLNISTFMDCRNPDSTYWVIDETKKFADMYNKTYINPNVYGSVVAKVRGQLTPTIEEKIKEKYPMTLRVKEIISVEKKNFMNTCVPYDFWGLGNEPGWSLQISEKENLIEFYLPIENKTYYFFYAEPKEENGVLTYQTYNQIQGYTIEIKIKKEKCSDTMSDNVYDYSVEVGLTGRQKYKGCGIKGKR